MGFQAQCVAARCFRLKGARGAGAAFAGTLPGHGAPRRTHSSRQAYPVLGHAALRRHLRRALLAPNRGDQRLFRAGRHDRRAAAAAAQDRRPAIEPQSALHGTARRGVAAKAALRQQPPVFLLEELAARRVPRRIRPGRAGSAQQEHSEEDDYREDAAGGLVVTPHLASDLSKILLANPGTPRRRYASDSCGARSARSALVPDRLWTRRNGGGRPPPCTIAPATGC